MEKDVAKRAVEDRRAFLDSQEENCGFPGCGQPRRLHNPFAHKAYRITGHRFTRKERGNEDR